MNISQSTISLIYTLLILLFILLGMMWGIIRGLKKSVCRGVFLVVTSIIFAVIAIFVSRAVINIDISFLNINVNGTKAKTVNQMIELYLSNIATEAGVSKEELSGLVSALTTLSKTLLAMMLFWVEFILFKYLLIPVNYAIYKWIFRSKAEKQYAKYKKQFKKNHAQTLAFSDLFNDDGFKVTPIDENESEGNDLGFRDLHKEENAKGEVESKNEDKDEIKANSEDLYLNREEENSINQEESFETNSREELKTSSVNQKYFPENEYMPVGVENETELPTISKPKKYRWWGALVGVFIGLFCAGMVLMPVNGVLGVIGGFKNYVEAKESEEVEVSESVVASGETLETDESQNDENQNTDGKPNKPKAKDVISYVAGDIPIYEYYDAYNNSVGNYIMKFSGTNLVSNLMFKFVTLEKINGTSISIAKDGEKILEAMDSFYEISTIDMKDKSQPNIEKMIDQINMIVDNVFDLSIVKPFVKPAINIGAEYAKKNLVKQDDEYANLLVALLDSLKTMEKSDEVRIEVKAYVNILSELNKPINMKDEQNRPKSILSILWGQEKIDILDILGALPDENIDSMVDSLFEYEEKGLKYSIVTITKSFPEIMSSGMKMAQDSINNALKTTDKFTYDYTVEQLKENFTTKELSGAFKDVLKDTIKLVKAYKVNGTGIAIKQAGKLLNKFKNKVILSDSSYESLMIVVREYANTFLNEQGSSLGLTEETINAITNKINKNLNWESELSVIGDAYIKFGEYNTKESPILPKTETNETDLENIKYKEIGEIIDIVYKSNQTTLLTKENINLILTDVLNKNIDEKTLGELYDYLGVGSDKDVKETLIDNITNITSYQIEFETLSKMFKGENGIKLNDIKTNPMKNLSKIGGALDEVKSGNIINDKVIKLLVKNAIAKNKLTGSDETTEKVNSFMDSISSNVDNVSSWKIELACIQEIIEFKDSMVGEIADNLPKLGEALDKCLSKKGVLITNANIANMVSSLINDYKIKANEGETLSAIQKATNNFLTSISVNLSNVKSWKDEFTHINNLKEEIKTEVDLKTIGSVFDTCIKGTPTLPASKIILNENIKDMISAIIDDNKNTGADLNATQSATNTLLESIKTNLGQAINDTDFSWSVEFGHIDNLNKNIESNLNLVKIGKVFDTCVKGDLTLPASKIILNENIKDMVSAIIDDNKNTGADLNATQSATNSLLDNIKTNLETAINDVDFSWSVEFGHIDNLNKNIESSLNLVKIGKVFDICVKGDSTLSPSKIILNKDIKAMISTIIDSYKISDSTNNMQTAMNKFFNTLNGNIGNVPNSLTSESSFSWEKELGHIENLKNNQGTMESIDIFDENAKTDTLGKMFDSIAYNYSPNESKNSELISKNMINTLISDMLDASKSKLDISDEAVKLKVIGVIDNIKKNIEEINNSSSYDYSNATCGDGESTMQFSWANELKWYNFVVLKIQLNNAEALNELKTENVPSKCVTIKDANIDDATKSA